MRLELLLLVAILAVYAGAQNPGRGQAGKQGANQQLVNLLKNLRKFRQQGRSPAAQVWKNNAVRFCKNFPRHPKCSNGKTPKYTDLVPMLAAAQRRVTLQRQQQRRKQMVMRRRKIKRIPKLNKRRDPLDTAPTDMAKKIPDEVRHWGRMRSEHRQRLRGVCARIDCKAWKAHKEKRERLKGQMRNFRKKVQLADQSDDDIELELTRTRQLKKALLEKADLGTDVEPADDGVFDSDLLLTKEQSEFLLNELDKGGVEEEEPLPPGTDPAAEAPESPTTPDPDYDASLAETGNEDYKVEAADPEGLGNEQPDEPVMSRMARAALFFEEQFVRKWDTSRPIQYTFHDSLESWDQQQVRQALQMISNNVPCLRFQYIANPVPNGYFLYYMKTDAPGFCGLSRIGRVQGGNEIYLSFQCNGNVGVAIHETMHSLGVDHQHIRMDRDKWIQVDWSNVNPQMYDSLAVSDAKTFTTYGVPYDYSSVMHYNAYTAAVDYNKPTLNPIYDAQNNIRVMGQRDAMTQRDTELLTKMYCKPANCIDSNIYCGAWALQQLCTSAGNGGWMQQNCRKSCNMC